MIQASKRMFDLQYILQNGEKKEKTNVFELLYSDPTDTYAFLTTMSFVQHHNFKTVSEKFDFSPFKKFVDIGGCLGLFSIMVKNAHPNVECVNFDLPPVNHHFIKYQEEHGMKKDSIKFQEGDFFKDEFPKTDVVAMGNILHDWGTEKKRILFRKAYNCLNENGVFLIVEDLLDDERKQNSAGLFISVLMISECGEGYNMSFKDIDRFAKEFGFKRSENLTEKFGANVVACYK